MIFGVLEVQNLALVKKTFPQNFLVDNEFNTCFKWISSFYRDCVCGRVKQKLH